MIVIGMLTVIFSLGVFFSLDIWRGTSFRSERDIVVSILTKARSRAMANQNESSWGACLFGGMYVIFQGSTCAAGDTISPSGSATTSWPIGGIVFDQLSGDSAGGSVVVTEDNRTATVTVNHEGTISW
jgi:Tfp pilus assembly protein FimT